ncbi:hypothetical protein FACS189429_2600 [Bacteroidia bacterium]|nr:hypothetical protein FACS189429_2600 [Bacteroidia bacterium]
MRYDTANIAPQTLPQPPSEIYTGNDFKYDEPGDEPNFFERLWFQIKKAIIRFLNKLFDWNLRADSFSGRQILWILLTVLLVVLLAVGFVFFFRKFRKQLGRNDDALIAVDEVERNLAETDLDTLIENALTAKNFRLTVRFYYLKILKLLAAKQIVDYQYQKTNYEYAYEIQNPNLRTLFREVSFVFDYCWYGEYEANIQDYLFAKQKFTEIEKLLNN